MCVAPPAISSCGSYTYIKCNSCNPNNFLQNPNFFLLTNLESNNYLAALLFQLKFNSQASSWVGSATCQPTTLTNCQTYSSFNVCTKCLTKSGYYLSNGICVPNPIPKINNCLVQSSLVECLLCKEGFYLPTDKSSCLAITGTIAKCELLDQSQSNATCKICKYPFYVNANKCDTERSVSKTIYYCKRLTANADTCDECHQGYQITDDKKKCLPVVRFCKTHASSSVTDTILSCTAC